MLIIFVVNIVTNHDSKTEDYLRRSHFQFPIFKIFFRNSRRPVIINDSESYAPIQIFQCEITAFNQAVDYQNHNI